MEYCGVIYKLTNKVNGLVYVGKTKFTGEHRLKCHKKLGEQKIKGGRFSLDPIQEAILEFGTENFTVETLIQGTSPEDLCQLEKAWISRLDSTEPTKGYNRTVGGDNGKKTQPMSPKRLQQVLKWIAVAQSKESVAKAAATRAARTLDKKKKISEKFSKVQKSRTFTNEFRQIVGARIRGYWENLTPEERRAQINKMHAGRDWRWTDKQREAFHKMMANRRAAREAQFLSEEAHMATLILSSSGIEVEEHSLALS